MPQRPSRLILVAATLTVAVGPANSPAQNITPDPARARIEIADVRRFAEVMRSLESSGAADTAAVIERDYLSHASSGLRAFAERYQVTGRTIAQAIAADPARYSDLDALADSLVAQEDSLRGAMGRLRELFPRAVFPPVWFFVADNRAGGAARQEGALIAAERMYRNPRNAVPLAMHELAHFQQAMVQGVETYQRIYGAEGTLLALALREGSAELIAELTAGRHINPAAERYGSEHEAQLWAQFRHDMTAREPGEWMWVQPKSGQPAELGYWMGYRIARSYYERADDKKQAILDILALTDFDGFLAMSGYEERLAQASAVK
jgi:hypothetical protein